MSELHARDPISDLGLRIAASVPLGPGAIAMVDSPRWPVDLDYSSRTPRVRADGARRRSVDAILRSLVAQLATHRKFRSLGRLGMFPTLPMHYFLRCIASPGCKPHLYAIGRKLLRPRPRAFTRSTIAGGGADLTAPINGGAIFTRFMLAGFATYRALEAMGVRTFESYPDLQFRLWSHGATLPPKKRRRDALAVRKLIDLKLARALDLGNVARIATLDEADAAILALGVATVRKGGALAVIENPYEGRFALALSDTAAEAIGLGVRIRT